MRNLFFLFFLSNLVVFSAFTSPDYLIKKHKDKNGREYQSIKNSPIDLRVYTSKNGLKVFLSKNQKQPRISTAIKVNVGAKNDPKNNTGLAHYLEHLLFNGTNNIATTNWEKEAPLLEEITTLYEKHKKEPDPRKKKPIYAEIQIASQEAAKYAIAGEFRKMMSLMGALEVNAYTNFDHTVYCSDIPSNELERWLSLESERFKAFVPRLFQTELETVYEEYNSRAYNNPIMKVLFPNHPYGETVIGHPLHLRNPSIRAIDKFFKTYYVPNNMHIILVGDLDYEETIDKIEKYFGGFLSKKINKAAFLEEKPILHPIPYKSYGMSDSVQIAYRVPRDEESSFSVHLISTLLGFDTVGLLDKNLLHPQKLFSAGSEYIDMDDYGIHVLYASPKEGQTLEEVRDLMLSEIQKVKDGKFDKNLLDQVYYKAEKNYREVLQEKRTLMRGLLVSLHDTKDMSTKYKELGKLKKLQKKQIAKFAKRFYKENYVINYQMQGALKSDHISPIALDATKNMHSEFFKTFQRNEPKLEAPQYVDFEKEIQRHRLNDKSKLYYIKNNSDDDFKLHFAYEVGLVNEPLLNAISYIFNYTKEGVRFLEELAGMKVKLNFNVRKDKSLIYLQGPQKSLEKSLLAFKSLIENLKPEDSTYQEFVKSINKHLIDKRFSYLHRFVSLYGKRASNSLYKRELLSYKTLAKCSPGKLIELLRDVLNTSHKVFFYGRNPKELIETLNNQFNFKGKPINWPENRIVELETLPRVYYLDNKDLASEIYFFFTKRIEKASKENEMFFTVFENYLSKILHEELREKRSLAYSFDSSISRLIKRQAWNYLDVFIESTPEKFTQVVEVVRNLMDKLPMQEGVFQEVKTAKLKDLTSKKLQKDAIFHQYDYYKAIGIKEDPRVDWFKQLQEMSFEDFKGFFNQHIRDKKYTLSVLTNKKNIDFEALSAMGEINELSEEELLD